jgi:hypothetical protein
MIFLSALQAASKSGTKFTICFNCGGSHHVSQCPKPTDLTRIKANLKIFRANKPRNDGANGTGSGPSTTPRQPGTRSRKWDPPTAEEKKNRNRRTIDGKVHYFHNKTKRWVPVNDQQTPPGPTGGPSTTLASPAAVPPTVGTVTPVASNQTRDVAVANAARQLELTFQGLLNQFSTGS